MKSRKVKIQCSNDNCHNRTDFIKAQGYPLDLELQWKTLNN
jgi:hypothetical protein